MALAKAPVYIQAGPRRGVAGGTPLEKYTEGASQSYVRSAPLILSSGKLVESTSPISSSNKLVGFAEAKATGVTDSEVLVVVPAPDYMCFIGTLSDATAGTHTSAITDIGIIYGILKDTGSPITALRGRWYLDANGGAATDGGLVIAFIDPIGTVDARCIFRITRPAILGG